MNAIKWNCLLVSVTILLLFSACGEKNQESISETEIIERETEQEFIAESESEEVIEILATEDWKTLRMQLEVMSQSMDMWRERTEYMQFPYFTVTDLDKNGRYELILAENAGSGRYTYALFFEVNETYDAMEPCEKVVTEGRYVGSDTWADFIIDETTMYYDEVVDKYYYIFEDYVRYGLEGNYVSWHVLYLEDGKMYEDVIASREVLFDNEGKSTFKYWNSEGERITEEQYRELIRSPFPELEAQTSYFSWECNTKLYEMDEEVFLGELEAICTDLYQYPLMITPTLTSEIEYAIESEGIYCIYNGEKFGYITERGEEITDYIYDMAYPFSEGLACVVLDGKYGFIDENGKMAIPFEYEEAKPFQEGLAYFVKDNTYGFLRPDGSVAFYLECDSVSSFHSSMAYYSIDGKYGYLDRSGQTVIEPVYSDASYFIDVLAFVEMDGLKGAIDREGDVVIPLIYDELIREKNCIVAISGKEEDYYDFGGEAFSQEEYTRISKYIEASNFTIELDYDNNMFFAYGRNGEKVVSIPCDYATGAIYGNSKSYVLKQTNDSGVNESILILEENRDVDMSDILLQNVITPRKEAYWNFIKEEREDYITKTRLYDFDDSGNPILYYYQEPCIKWMCESDSAFYSTKNGEIQRLCSGREAGMGYNDWVCLWRDVESGEVFLGTCAWTSGLDVSAVYSTVFGYESGDIKEKVSFAWNCQKNGSNQEDKYLVAGEEISVEEYENLYKKYTYFELFDICNKQVGFDSNITIPEIFK